MARSVTVASDATNVQATATATTLLGYSVRENAATAAAASVVLRNGTTTSDPAVAVIELAANSSDTAALPAVECPSGVFVERSGTSEIVLYTL